MARLSQEQLARLALGLTEDADLTAHLQECASCRARGETMQSLVRQLTAAHAKFDSGHQEARERLMEILPANRPLAPTRTKYRITHWIGKLSMRQRMAMGGVGTLAVLAILLLWLGTSATPLSAMEKMAEDIRKAKSFRAVTIAEIQVVFEAGKPPDKWKMTGAIDWLAQGTCREDTKVVWIDANGRTFEEEDITDIEFRGESKGIFIDRKAKSFSKDGSPKEETPGREMIAKLGEFFGQANRELDAKEINGKKCRGFEIGIKELNGRRGGIALVEHGTAQIWIDPDSNLPVLIQYNANINIDRKTNAEISGQICDFQWNIDLDPKLFDTTPPEGYADVTLKESASTVKHRIHRSTDTLRLYAEWTGGHYPKGLNNLLESEDTSKELLKTRGFKDNTGKVDPEVQWLLGGLDRIADLIQSENLDAAYYGKTVGPGDKDKVLLRWKLDDGKYAVIYGDLHYETVTAEKLRALEGNK